MGRSVMGSAVELEVTERSVNYEEHYQARWPPEAVGKQWISNAFADEEKNECVLK